MIAMVEKIVANVKPDLLRRFAVDVVTQMGPRFEATSDETIQRWDISLPHDTGILLTPEATVAVYKNIHRLGFAFVEMGPLTARPGRAMADAAWIFKSRLEKLRTQVEDRPRLAVRLGLPPAIDHHGFIADVVLAYRRVYPLADWIVVDALDALARPWSPEPHRFVLEPLMVALQEWNRHYVMKPLLLRIPVPVGGHVRSLIADLAERHLISGLVLASGWRQDPASAEQLRDGIEAARKAAGKPVPCVVEGAMNRATDAALRSVGGVLGVVDPLAGVPVGGYPSGILRPTGDSIAVPSPSGHRNG